MYARFFYRKTCAHCSWNLQTDKNTAMLRIGRPTCDKKSDAAPTAFIGFISILISILPSRAAQPREPNPVDHPAACRPHELPGRRPPPPRASPRGPLSPWSASRRAAGHLRAALRRAPCVASRLPRTLAGDRRATDPAAAVRCCGCWPPSPPSASASTSHPLLPPRH